MDNFKISDVLVKPLSESFTCTVCTELLMETVPLEAMQCSNGHVLCSTCWKSTLDNKNKKECHCPLCRVKIKADSLSRNLFLEGEFKKKKIYCKNKFKEEKDEEGKFVVDEEKGCKSIFIIEEMETHFKNCQYSFIECPNSSECKNRFRKNQLEQHNLVCEYLKVPCKYCYLPIAIMDNKEHLERDCQSFKIECADCNQEMLRKNYLLEHQDICEEKTIQCKYKDGGCTATFKRKLQTEHLSTENNHMIYIQNIIDRHRILLDESDRGFKRLKTEHEQLEKKFCNINKYSNVWVIENWNQKVIDIPNDEAGSTKRVSAPMFYFNSKKYNISCFPNGFTSANKDFISLYLHLHETSPNINIKFSFEIVNSIDSSKSIKKEKNSYFISDKGVGFEKFAECKTINQVGEGFIVNNKLTIKFEIEIPQTTDSLTTK